MFHKLPSDVRAEDSELLRLLYIEQLGRIETRDDGDDLDDMSYLNDL